MPRCSHNLVETLSLMLLRMWHKRPSSDTDRLLRALMVGHDQIGASRGVSGFALGNNFQHSVEILANLL